MQPLLGLVDANKTLAIFFSAPFESFFQFLPNAFMSQTLQLFFVIATLIFCSLCLMFFVFCVSCFVGGLPHQKGACILDVFYRINWSHPPSCNSGKTNLYMLGSKKKHPNSHLT